MPRTARSTPARGRILAVAGAAAALAGAGTAAAASASAATVPARTTVSTTAVSTTAAVSAPAPRLAAGLTINAPRHVLTTTAGASPLAPASTAATPATATTGGGSGSHGSSSGGHGSTAVTTTVSHAAGKTSHAGHPATSHARHHAGPAGPYQMYDSVTPSAIPGGKPIATYADGPYAASPAALHGKNVTWIDTNGTDPKGATVLDVEPGDATPAGAAAWASHRLDAHPHATAVIYTMRSEWAATQTAITTLPHWQQHHIRWWIADPTGTPHLVPGSDATQWYWGTHYDISTATPNF